MAQTATNAEDVRAGLRHARGASFVLDETFPGTGLFRIQRWIDAPLGISFCLNPCVVLKLNTPSGLLRKYVMQGLVDLSGDARVNVCVSAWETEIVSRGPWSSTKDLGLLVGYVWTVCIEDINHTNIARPRIEDLSQRDCQEIAFLIEAPLREMLERYATQNGSWREKFDGPLLEFALQDWPRQSRSLTERLNRGEITPQSTFAVWARQTAYKLGQGVNELDEQREFLSNWQRPDPALVAFHAAGADAVRSFNPRQIADLPFERYFESDVKHPSGRPLGVLGEPDVRIVLHPTDREDPNSSRATVELGSHRIEFETQHIGFGSPCAHGNMQTTTVMPDTESLEVFMIQNPCGTLFASGSRLDAEVTPAMVDRALRHLRVVLLSPQFGLRGPNPHRHHQVFSI